MSVEITVDVRWGDASHVEEQEREALVRRAQAALAPSGVVTCGDCGCDIPPARRAAAPFATRCITCQMIYERRAA